MSVNPPLREVVRQMLPKVKPRGQREPKPAKRRRYTGATQEVLDVVRARCRGRCERCTQVLAGGDPHHRIARGMGGSKDPRLNQASAIVAICRECHDDIELHRIDAKVDGWLLERRDDPTLVAVTSLLHGRVLLADDGSVQPAEAAS